jgi:hypothetical protein
MALIPIDYVQFFQKWFSGSAPNNAAKAIATLTISGNVADGEVVVIGSETYEIDTNGSVNAGNIRVDVSVGGVGAANAVTKLVAAITANSTIVDAFDGIGNVVDIQAKNVGTEGNDINVSKVMTNGSFGAGVTKLSGGLYATPSKTSKCFIIIGGTWYIATKPIDKYTTDGWVSFTPSLVS